MRLYHRREIADTEGWFLPVQEFIAVRKGDDGTEGNRPTFGRRRKLDFLYRDQRILWVAFSRSSRSRRRLRNLTQGGGDYSSSMSIFSSLRCIWVSDCFWRPCRVLLLRLRPVWRVERVEG